MPRTLTATAIVPASGLVLKFTPGPAAIPGKGTTLGAQPA